VTSGSNVTNRALHWNKDYRTPDESAIVKKGRELSGLGISYEADCY
jgi:hypothetical protein